MSDDDGDGADGNAVDEEVEADEEAEADGGRTVTTEANTHTVRLELVDKPGQLLAALKPIAENGGNLLSIYHERGNMTPRGHIPVEVDFEATPDRFDGIVDALRAEGINVMQAGTEQYGEEITLLLVGHLIDTDLSDTLTQIEECASASVSDVSLSAPEGTDQASSARLRLATRTGETADAVDAVRTVVAKKNVDVIEPLTEVDA